MKNLAEFRRGYKPLLGAAIGAGCGLSSIGFYTHGAFAAAIATDTGWTRGAIQVGVSIMILAGAITAPTMGWVIDRYGARRVALFSLPMFGITLAGLSFATESIWTYYAGWVLMSIVAAGTLPTTWTRVVIDWFDDYRGIALGLTMGGTGLAATLAPGYVTWLIGLSGWRTAYVVLGGTIMIIALPVVYALFRVRPDNPARAQKDSPGTDRYDGVTLMQALTGYRFWVMVVSIVLVAFGISGLITNLMPLLMDKGLVAAEAAYYAVLIGISVIVGRLLAGFLLDHVWAPLIACVFLGAPGIAALLLSYETLTPLWIGGVALIIGLAAGAELDLMAFLASRYFGLRHYGALYGGVYVAFSLGAGLAPAAFGLAYDEVGSYESILRFVTAISLVGALLMLTLGRYPKWPRAT